MKLLPTDQKDQIKVFVAVLAVAGAGLYYTYVHEGQVAENEAMRERIEQLEGANDKARRAVARGELKQLKAEAARSRATLAVLRRLVPLEHEVPALLDQVSTAARRAGLEIGGVQPEPVLAGETFDTYRYKVTLVGGYHPLATFLANVGTLPRIVAPVTFALIPSRAQAAQQAAGPQRSRRVDAPMPLEAQLTIQTYVVRPEAPAKADHSETTHTESRGGEVMETTP